MRWPTAHDDGIAWPKTNQTNAACHRGGEGGSMAIPLDSLGHLHPLAVVHTHTETRTRWSTVCVIFVHFCITKQTQLKSLSKKIAKIFTVNLLGQHGYSESEYMNISTPTHRHTHTGTHMPAGTKCRRLKPTNKKCKQTGNQMAIGQLQLAKNSTGWWKS